MNRVHLAVWMERGLPEALISFLPQRRWFGGKARPIDSVTFEDAAWLPHPRRPCALVVVRVRDNASEETTYALLVAFDREPGRQPVVGRVEGEHEAVWATEAAADESVALALLAGFTSGGGREVPMYRGGLLRFADIHEAAARVLDGNPVVRPLGVEQSNTSLCVDRTLAFKLFRRLEHGENPELEVGRFLTRHTAFRAMPLLRGSLTYISPRGQPATLGILQDWIESQGDGWSHVLALLRARHDDSTLKALQQEMFSLGLTTAGLHRALSTNSDQVAFTPEPATRTDVEMWRGIVVTRLSRAANVIAGHMPSWPLSSRILGETFVDHSRAPAVLDRLPDPEQPSSRFWKIRVHGDYHLGQTLRAADGYVLIDFEGEPARRLAERREKQAALKDVAGMLRSVDYVVEVAQTESPVPEDEASRAPVLRQGFLDGYRSALDSGADRFVPPDPRAINAWTDFFELEKALYEVEYEINNRPAWVHIPLRGLVRLVTSRAKEK